MHVTPEMIRARNEDLTWLADTGESLSGAAARLGITPGGVEKHCRTHHLPDVLEALRSREPRDWNSRTAGLNGTTGALVTSRKARVVA